LPEVNEFQTDTHRRVTAQCLRPRSAREIAYELQTVDASAADDAKHPDGVNEYLKDLEADGLVVNLGPFEAGDGEGALAAQNGNEQALNFEGDTNAFVARSKHPLRFPIFEQGEDHYVMTNLGHARLTGEAPTTPEGQLRPEAQALREGWSQ
jgi:uncharacterized protein YciI